MKVKAIKWKHSMCMLPKLNFTLIAQYWLVPGTDSRVFISANSFLHNRPKIISE